MANRRYVSDTTRAALKPFAAFLGAVVLLLVLRKLPFTGAVFARIEGTAASMGASFGRGVTRFVASEDSLAVRLKVCQEDKGLLAREAVEFARLQDENQELREILGYKEMENREGITARIIARSLPEETSKVILDKGESHGVSPGSTVVVGQGIVFGVVTSTTENTSVVTLITSTESEVPAAILGKKKTVGLIQGRDGAVLSMEFVPREAGVVRGDVVVSSGLNGQIPEGLLLGTVTDVVDMESAPFAEALVEPLQDSIDWSMVLILP